MNFIGKKLKKKKNLLSISLKFRNCTLFNNNITKILDSFKIMKNLKNFYINFSENNLNDDFVTKICKNLNFENLVIFEILLNDTKITNSSYEKILQNLQKSQKIEILNIEIMNKEKPENIFNKNFFFIQKKNLLKLRLNFSYNILTNLGITNFSENLQNCQKLINLEIIFYETNLTFQKIEKIFFSISKLKNLNKIIINIARNNLCDNTLFFLNQILPNFIFLQNLELHLYGNKFCDEDYVDLLDVVSCLGLERFLFSIKEFLVNDKERVGELVMRKFGDLRIGDKIIC